MDLKIATALNLLILPYFSLCHLFFIFTKFRQNFA